MDLSIKRLKSIRYTMRTRCYNKNHWSFKYYGARGITICEEWLNSFENFYEWAMSNGYSDVLTIERNDNDGSYCPSNCCWATMEQQGKNKRKIGTVRARRSGVHYNTKKTKKVILKPAKKSKNKIVTLQQYLEEKGISQDKAALEIGINRSYLNQIVNERMPAGRLVCVKLSRWSGGKINLTPLMGLGFLEEKIKDEFDPALSRKIDNATMTMEG